MNDSRSIPRTARIGEINHVDDLDEGGRAIPESDREYGLRLIGGSGVIPGLIVRSVVRSGGVLWACCAGAGPIDISSDESTHSLVPQNRRLVKSRRASDGRGCVPRPFKKGGD